VVVRGLAELGEQCGPALAHLEILRLTDCRALDALHLAPLTALRELAISGASPDAPAGASRLELIDLGAARQLEELRLYDLPALRELRLDPRTSP